MRRVNKRKNKKNRRNNLGFCICVICILAVSIFGITLCMQISGLRKCVNNAVNNIQEVKDNTVTYDTNLNYVYIPKSVSNKLAANALNLNIDMKNAVIDVAENYSGLVKAPKLSKSKIEIDGESITCVKVLNTFETGKDDRVKVDSVKLKVDNVKEILEFTDALDIYVKQDNKFVISKTIEVSEYIELNLKEQYLVYIPVENITADEPLIIYNKLPNKLEIYVEPKNATYAKLKFSNYDENVLQITESGEILPSKTGTTKITCTVGNIQKEIALDVVSTVEKITVNKPSTTIKLGNWSYVIPTVYPQDAANSTLVWTSSDESVATVEDGMIKSIAIGSCVVTVMTKTEPKVECKINVTVTGKATGYYTQGTGGYPETIIEGPYYVDGILMVNKKYSIPSDFATGLDDEAISALYDLQAAARAAGYSLPLLSGFRTYDFQQGLYESYIYREGQAEADTYSARPGHSEHSTGLAFDVGSITDSYGTTPAGKWLAKNCHKYGFIIRYPQGKSNITGYIYEPWHIRYLGVENATKVYESGLTLEEYLGLD